MALASVSIVRQAIWRAEPQASAGMSRRMTVHAERTRLAHVSMVPRISRADLAEFMLRQLSDSTYVRRSPAVMY
jgi:hypothetical protein